MDWAFIVSLVASIAGAISAVAAVISCILHYRLAKPNIKIYIKQNYGDCSYASQQFTDGKVHCCCMMRLSLANTSSVGGTIGRIAIVYNKKRYDVETIGSTYDPKPYFSFEKNPKNPQDMAMFRLKVPIVLQPYSATMGYFFLPDFPALKESRIKVDVEFTLIDTKRRVRKIRNIVFDRLDTNTVKCHLHYQGTVTYCTGTVNHTNYDV